MIRFDYIPTPFGRGVAAVRNGRLAALRWAAGPESLAGFGPARRDPGALRPFRRQIADFFAGKRVRLGPLDLPGATPFARRVYAAVARIPYCQTRTYGEIADAAGRPGAARAVGTLMARNPLCLGIPCHRVVAAGGLGGFSGGLDRKRHLLALEGATFRPS
ncbi:MAG TPA: methylated-DNA--[protein]-cysteine S-methyltransferase [Candidatus Eisenbacteria bacterium]|nr:methylated-DNA--[protein]-cysteine S-methyltransferase [Candidatus Eisenbacteria bacterium]